MKAIIKTITPEYAAELLSGNLTIRNRTMSDSHVRLLMREMESGRWKLNGDAIRLYDGELLDGQHRLEACRRSGIPLKTIVVEVEPDVFDTIDCGKRRSSGDVLSIRGEKNTYLLAAALTVVGRYLTSRMYSKTPYTSTEIESLLNKHPGIRASVAACAGGRTKLMPPSILAGLHYLFSIRDQESADRLLEKIIKGANLSESDPVFLLRERLMNNSIAKAKLSNPYIAALTIKAWNATRDGKRMNILKFSEEGVNKEVFPTIK